MLSLSHRKGYIGSESLHLHFTKIPVARPRKDPQSFQMPFDCYRHKTTYNLSQ